MKYGCSYCGLIHTNVRDAKSCCIDRRLDYMNHRLDALEEKELRREAFIKIAIPIVYVALTIMAIVVIVVKY